MAMRGDQGMGNRHPADLADGRRTGYKARIEFADPARQGLARSSGIARRQGHLNLAECLTESPKTDCSVEHEDVKGELSRRMQTTQAPVDQTHPRDR